MCRPRCRRGHGCWTRAARTRPTRTTRVRRRSWRCGTGTCGRSRSRTTARCCGCWRAVITSSPRLGPGRSVGCTRCLREMIEGGLSKNLSAKRASIELRKLRPHDPVGDRTQTHRRRVPRRGPPQSTARSSSSTDRIDRRREGRRTSVTDVFGVGPIVACYLIGYSGDVRRFPTAGHYARYNATAPIEASSGPTIRHRLNPNGNRQLNHAIHIAALGQISHDTPGRAYYLAKQSRREVTQGSDALPETTHQRRRLPTTPRRHSTAERRRAREGNQGRL